MDTNIKISDDFQDDVFKFNYETVNAKESLKFNEAGDAFYYELNAKSSKEEDHESFFETKTISLFDKHIEKAKLYGMQYHFHSPSEHSIDGQLLDLEMHIVHSVQSDLVGEGKDKSQFSNGVMGFMFKCMPDSYFDEIKKENPKVDIEYHDKFLADLAATEE